MTDIILDSISDGVFTVDNSWRVTSFNRAAELITGIDREDAMGKLCHEVFKSNMCENECPLRRTMHSGKAIIDKKGYCLNPVGERVPISVSTALLKDGEGNKLGGAETFRDLREIEALKAQLEAGEPALRQSSRNAEMSKVLDTLRTFADSYSTVLIQGETGTGKEVLARELHRLSNQAKGPFVALNCAALPDSLLESELFGYKRGAFTGADRDKVGRFKLAEHGTLFLDEIGDISQAMQVKLLRVLQERVYEPLGSTKSERTSARIVCATNKDLASLVAEGHFRQDLYFRINVLLLSIPPLRDRLEDLPDLATHFLHLHAAEAGKRINGFSEDVFAAFYAYPWPGNIRELENMVERAVVLCGGDLIEEAPLPSASLPPQRGSGRATGQDLEGRDGIKRLRMESERGFLIHALEGSAYQVSAAASVLGIDRATLYRKMKRYGIEPRMRR